MLNAYGHEVHKVDTSFGRMLKTVEWLPASTLTGSDQNSGRLEIGSKLFVKSREARQLFAGHVSYLLPDPDPTSKLASFLGIQQSISVEFTAEMLKSWCDRRENASTPTTFATSLQHIQSVYNFLEQNMTKVQLDELLRGHPVVFYPCSRSADIVEGRFLFWSEVVWVDETRLFEKYRESLLNADPASAKLYRYPLHGVYPDMEEFFRRTVHVMKSPGIADLVKLSIHISGTSVVPKALPDVLSIFSMIGQTLLTGEVDDMLRSLLEQLKAEKVIPGKKGCWLHLDCRPMIADDRDLEKKFEEDATVFFVDCGEKLGVGNTRKKGADKGPFILLTYFCS